MLTADLHLASSKSRSPTQWQTPASPASLSPSPLDSSLHLSPQLQQQFSGNLNGKTARKARRALKEAGKASVFHILSFFFFFQNQSISVICNSAAACLLWPLLTLCPSCQELGDVGETLYYNTSCGPCQHCPLFLNISSKYLETHLFQNPQW